MRYKKMGNTDEMISVIGLGTWAYGNDFWRSVDDQLALNTISEALELGINLFDTAPSYGRGKSEEILGRALSGKRCQAFIATKCGTVRKGDEYHRDLRPESIRAELEESLRRLKTDYVDLLLLHWPDVNTPLEDTLSAIIDMKKTGKIRYFGVSNFSKEELEIIRSITELDCYEPQYSVLSNEKEEEMDYAKKNDVGVITYGSLAAGVLTGKFQNTESSDIADKRTSFYPFFQEPFYSKSKLVVSELEYLAQKYHVTTGQIALAFVANDERVTSAIIGARTPQQLRENAGASELILEKGDFMHIHEIRKHLWK